MSHTPQVLIMGHSFVHRFHTFLAQGSDRRVRLDQFDLSEVGRLKPEIVIQELGSNDLSPPEARPELVGSKIESLVQLLHAKYGVKFVVVCQTITRALCPRGTSSYNDRV